MSMLKKSLFKRPVIELELKDKALRFAEPSVPDEMCVNCPACKKTLFTGELEENEHVCPKCGHHFRINSRQRLNLITDQDSFREMDEAMISSNRLNFPEYEKKLRNATLESAEKEAVITGFASIGGQPCGLFIMEPFFMMGSMGTVVGEKITRLFEKATEDHLPVIGFTVSGGARMQEGILSLMQMAKTSAAVKRHNDGGNLYITVLTDPTTGGVTASFAMLGDIILSEPGALVGFAGPRVIQQTIQQKLPAGFQRAEFLLERGYIDRIVDRREQTKLLVKLLTLHRKKEN